MLLTVSYGIGAAAFGALVVLMLLKRRPKAFGIGVLLTCGITALWAVFAALQSWWMPGVAHALESVRSASWLWILASILAAPNVEGARFSMSRWLPWAAIAIGIVATSNDFRFLTSTTASTMFTPSQILGRIVISVCGILMVENLYRNTPAGRRWHVSPLCIAIGALFVCDLFVFCEAVILKSASVPLLASRGVVLALIVPLMLLTMARNPDWNIDVHVSRGAVFQGATLTAAGIFLLLAASVASLIGHLPAAWGGVSEIAFFFGSVILLLTVLSTESFRSRFRRLIAENFFSTRYDYRLEWLRSIATLSSVGSDEQLAVRAIRAIIDVVDSPGGVLWLETANRDYAVAQMLNMSVDASATERSSDNLVNRLRSGVIVEFRRVSAQSREGQAEMPAWGRDDTAWLAVPLLKVDRLEGFVVIRTPRATTQMNWESRDLLLAIGQQVASYLAEERATRTLLESSVLIEQSKRFAFVMHDIKNVAGQLSLMIANVPRFGERAEFRADLTKGMENSVRKLNDLLGRLRPGNIQTVSPQIANLASVLNAVVDEFQGGANAIRREIGDDDTRVCISPVNLHAIFTHLIANALEASPAGAMVVVSSHRVAGTAMVDITDKGGGMSQEFIRTELFAPYRSSKPTGHGVGAFQARDLARSAKGDIEVISAIGRGTTVRVKLPYAAVDMTRAGVR